MELNFGALVRSLMQSMLVLAAVACASLTPLQYSVRIGQALAIEYQVLASVGYCLGSCVTIADEQLSSRCRRRICRMCTV